MLKGNHGDKNFLVFSSMLNSLTLDNNTNHNVSRWILTGTSPAKIKLFNFSLVLTMSKKKIKNVSSFLLEKLDYTRFFL